jgi:hypothetical protein
METHSAKVPFYTHSVSDWFYDFFTAPYNIALLTAQTRNVNKHVVKYKIEFDINKYENVVLLTHFSTHSLMMIDECDEKSLLLFSILWLPAITIEHIQWVSDARELSTLTSWFCLFIYCSVDENYYFVKVA